MAVRMSVVAPHTTTYLLVCKMEPTTTYPLWLHLITSIVTVCTSLILFNWSNTGSEVDSYTVTWERDTARECPDVDEGSVTITGGSISYTILRLQEDSNYTITVAATNAAGSTVSVPVTGMTGEAGEELET